MLTLLQQLTPPQLFQELLPKLFASDLSTAEIGRVEFRITCGSGQEGGTWLIDFDARTIEANETRNLRPHIILEAAALDFMALVDGTMSPADGILTERLKMTGELSRIEHMMTFWTQLRQITQERGGTKR